MSGGLVEWLLKKPADATHHEVESEEDDDYENSIDVPKVLLAAGAVGVVGLFALWMTRNTPTPAAGAIARAPEAGGPVAAAPAVETGGPVKAAPVVEAGGRKRGREGEDMRPAVKRPAVEHSEVKEKDEISDSDSDDFVDALSETSGDGADGQPPEGGAGDAAAVVEPQIPEFVTFYATKLKLVLSNTEIADVHDERYHITSEKITEMVHKLKQSYKTKYKSNCTTELARIKQADSIMIKIKDISNTIQTGTITNQGLLNQMNLLNYDDFFNDNGNQYVDEIADSTVLDPSFAEHTIPWQYLCISAYLFYVKALLWPGGQTFTAGDVEDSFVEFDD